MGAMRAVGSEGQPPKVTTIMKPRVDASEENEGESREGRQLQSLQTFDNGMPQCYCVVALWTPTNSKVKLLVVHYRRCVLLLQ